MMPLLKNFISVKVVVLIFSAFAAAECSSPASIAELQTCWTQSWNDKKLDSVMRLYAEDETLLTADGRFINRDMIGPYWKGVSDAANVQFQINIIQPVQEERLGYVSGTFNENKTVQDKPPVLQQGGYLVVAEERGGKWVIVQQVFIVLKPTPPAPAIGMFA